MREPRDPLLKVVYCFIGLEPIDYILHHSIGVCNDIDLEIQRELVLRRSNPCFRSEERELSRSTLCAQVER